jgi:phosphatidylinositol-3,4,5-trisphosphate 3-phosphatase/dual-specificity protein phosphatase PTEN
VLTALQAGKGRTGTVIACYLLYSGLFKEAVHAKSYFGFKRSQTNWGVVGPAQVRYGK